MPVVSTAHNTIPFNHPPQRGAAIINARKASSALSAARAAVRHMRSWVCGTNGGEFVSMGVLSDANTYGVQKGRRVRLGVQKGRRVRLGRQQL